MTQQQKKDMSQYFYRASAADFMQIPGGPVAYWLSDNSLELFSRSAPLESVAEARKGMVTARNDLYVRHWYEISKKKLCLDAESRGDAEKSEKKWFPYIKGGDFRKWYGNKREVVDWENDGLRLRTTMHPRESRIWATNFNLDYIFQPNVNWSDVTSGCFSARISFGGELFDATGLSCFPSGDNLYQTIAYLNSKVAGHLLSILNPTLHFQAGNIASLPFPDEALSITTEHARRAIEISRCDWDLFETSWDFASSPLLKDHDLRNAYVRIRENWRELVAEMVSIERVNNERFIDICGLDGELSPLVPSEEITLNCNPDYRYGGNRSEEELETLLQCDTLKELVSYSIGCMMGRYSIDKPGLILASQGETLQDYLNQIPSPRFMPDDDAILPLTDQEWFPDDATNRFREFVRVVWGDEHLQENLDFVAESLCLHAIKPKRGESALDTIRRYLSTQFFKDHMRTYKKRPIYWLFSSGKQKAFECLVYLHRYNEGTLARMRTEYVIPLTAKMAAHAQKLEKDKEASNSAAEIKRLEKQIATLHKQQAELAEFDEKLRHYADQRISLDLDDGVKVNYGKFGDLLAEVKAITGKDPEVN
ncbi:BREX-1 system adenine-specific DNA-methyltransferase PglX [Microbulbifer thermotolerans]|uniref:BREX-1 system adenine-specific DNA-methyltransferase PglX n=1 Tax=Microbulbifer thermotolerans TaxID=252514 RepID=UPI0022498311|nr:BREX-1 system adenine-specific DNA-methyltransferase PglX [Microbulbifer thermotolerans]MCX2795338.1 BREX-1 system adenine-specific DNA-methyltransferase PglX [Microbulbifer thermotolerans]